MSVLRNALGPAGLLLLVCCTNEKSLGGRSDPSSPSTENDAGAGDPTVGSAEGRAFAIRKMVPGAVVPGGKKELVYVALRAKNVSADPFAVVFTDFTLGTTADLLVPPAAETLKDLENACAGQVQLDKGGELSCTVAFEVDIGTAKDLVYRLPSGKSLQMPLPPRLCNALESLGETVTDEVKKPVPAIPAGGAADLPNGDYFMTRRIVATAPQSGPSVPAAMTFRITDGRFELLYKELNPNVPSTADTRVAGTIETAGDAFTMKSDCFAVGSTRTDRIDDDPKPVLTATDHRYFPDERKLVVVTDLGYSEYSSKE